MIEDYYCTVLVPEVITEPKQPRTHDDGCLARPAAMATRAPGFVRSSSSGSSRQPGINAVLADAARRR